MRKIALAALFGFLLIATAGTVSAQKTTIDPNTLPRATDIDQSDTRLEQKVTYEAMHKPVRTVLADLTKLTGVTLKAGINQSDWQVRDRKMNIFAKDAPLKDLMDSIARVMKFVWASAGKGDKKTYRIFMDRKTLLDAESKAARDRERKKQQLADKRKRALMAFANPNPPTEAELAKMKENSPMQYLAAKSGVSSGLGIFFREMPIALEAMASGSELTLSGSNLSPAARAGLADAISGIEKSGMGFNLSSNSDDDILSSIGSATIHINQGLQMAQSASPASWLLGKIHVFAGYGVYDLVLPDPDSKAAALIAKTLAHAYEEEVSPAEQSADDFRNKLSQAEITDMQKGSTGEDAPKRPDDPTLLAKIKLQPKSSNLADVEKGLHDVAKFAIVSDSCGALCGVSYFNITGEVTIKDVLDKISDSYMYNWDKHKGVIEFRDKEWYRRRANQIPDAWLEKWKMALKKNSALDLDSLSEIASLSFDQIQQNLISDPELERSGIAAKFYRDLLKLYGSLTGAQRKQLFTTTGIDLATLSSNQWALAEVLISQRSASFLQNPNARLTLTTIKTKNTSYTFTLASSEEMQPVTWVIQIPAYQEPPKAAAKNSELLR